MKGEFVALSGRVPEHKKRARMLLEKDGRLPYELSSTMGALCTAYSEWDEKLAAFYAIELYTLIEERLSGS